MRSLSLLSWRWIMTGGRYAAAQLLMGKVNMYTFIPPWRAGSWYASATLSAALR